MPAPTTSTNRFPAIAAAMRRDVDMVVRAATSNVNERIHRSFQAAKSGRTYRIPGGGSHRASAPGEAPAILFGTFANTTRPAFPRPMLGVVYTTDEKGPHLEYGTAHMAARPSFGPGLDAEKDAFGAAMRVVLGRLG